MKFPKTVAIFLIIGLALQSVSFPETVQGLLTVSMEAPLANNSREKPLSIMQGGEQSIDPFTVHPKNRWDVTSAGLSVEMIADGELSFQTFINDSATMERYRESQTADDEIGVRWRLNATADFESNETDVPTVRGDSGADGYSWEEATADNWTPSDGSAFSFADGDLIVENTVNLFDGARVINTPFNLSGILTDWRARVRVNDTTVDGHRLGTALTVGVALSVRDTIIFTGTGGWQVFEMEITSQNMDALFVQKNGIAATTKIEIEYFRLFIDDQYPGDFEIPISGINATISGGTGNTTINAYPFNSSHYTIRPTLTTGDGSNWRSWYMASNYQDWFQLDGEKGADGIEFIDSIDGATFLTSTGTANNGILTVDATGAPFQFWVMFTGLNDITTSDFDFLTIKLRANRTDLSIEPFIGDSTGAAIGALTAIPIINFTSIQWNLSADSDWTGVANGISFKIDEVGGDGILETEDGIFIDSILLTTTNDTSDLTFFAYETYFRSEYDFNLRRSALEIVILDDNEDDLVEEKIGEFALYDFFDPAELLPDVFAAQVGRIDYLFGIKSAGANVSMVWDYYEAEFVAFSFDLVSIGEAGDSWEAIGPFAAHNKADAGGATSVSANFQLVIPEFDSSSGRFVIEEISGLANTAGVVEMDILSVNSTTGDLNLESITVFTSSDDLITTYNRTGVRGNFTFPVNDSRDGFAEITFTMNHDKQSNFFLLQIAAKDDNSKERRGAATWPLLGDSNEIVIRLIYGAISTAINAEVIISFEDWSLTFRDLFGLPIDLPSIDAVGGGIFDVILWPIVAILNVVGAIPDAIGAVFGALGSVISQLSSIEGILGLVTSAIDGIGSAITASVDAIGSAITAAVDLVSDAVEAMEAVLEAAIEAVENAVDLVTTAVNLVTAAVIAIAGQIITALVAAIEDLLDELLTLLGSIFAAVVTFIRAIEIQGVVVGDVLDVIFSYLGLFTATAATTLAFLIMLVTEWSLMIMVFLFLAILFFSIGASNAPGEVFGYVFKAYSTNTTPFSVYGFKMHIPLAFWNLPFLAIVVLGIA